jgi:hypothetical protein
MAVVINELEHIPPTESRAETRGGLGGDAHVQGAAPAAQRTQVLTVIRREASRQARLWAD